MKKVLKILSIILTINAIILSSVYLWITRDIYVTFTEHNGLMIAAASVNGNQGNFLIDTGANSSVIYSRFYSKYNIKPTPNLKGIVEVANGNKSVVPVTVSTINFGNKIYKDTKMYMVPEGNDFVDGIIGNDILSKTTFYVDRKKNCIVIKHSAR